LGAILSAYPYPCSYKSFSPVFFVAVRGQNGHTLGTGRRSAPVIGGTVRSNRMAWSFSLSVVLFFAMPSHAQSGSRPPSTQKIDGSAAPADVDETRDRIARDMAKKANLDRQAALKNDTDKLFKLATELKDSVDKSNENVLSLEVLKKAEEIEKLAHSVKEKMKGPN
jgi:hypothetical protein